MHNKRFVFNQVSVCGYVHVCAGAQGAWGGGQISDAGVMGGCKLSDMGAGA